MALFLRVFFTLFLGPLFAWGYLGEQTNFMAQMRVQNSPSVVQVTEQTDEQGLVRHVHWQGPTRPNFKEVLGSCYEFYHSEMKSRARARGPGAIIMENENCRIKVSGGMGHIYGEAHLK